MALPLKGRAGLTVDRSGALLLVLEGRPVTVDAGWLFNLNERHLAQGTPNPSPEHERECGADSQQNAGDHPAMPTAKLGTCII